MEELWTGAAHCSQQHQVVQLQSFGAVLGVGDDKLRQALAGVVDNADEAVFGARPRKQGLVLASLNTVIMKMSYRQPV